MSSESFGAIKLTRPPVRIAYPVYQQPVPGMPGCAYTLGREAVLDFDWTRLPDEIAVDIEGAGKDGRKKTDLKSVQIADKTHCLVLDPRDPAQHHRVHQIVNSGRRIILHNSTFDAPNMHLTGMLELDTCFNVWDTAIWSRGANPSERGGHKLFQVLHRHLGIGDGKDGLTAMLKRINVSKTTWFETYDLDTPSYLLGAVVDAIGTARLAPVVRQAFYDRLTSKHPFGPRGVSGDEAWRLVDREQIINQHRIRRQCIGILYDPEYLDQWRLSIAGDLAEWEREIVAAGVKPAESSNGSLMRKLDEWGVLPERYPRLKNGQPSGSKDNLKKINHPFVDIYRKHKNLDHLDKDYMAKVHHNADPNGRIHPGQNMLVACTGRASIGGDAPLQQFSGASRGILLADDWEEARRTMKHPVLDENGDAAKCTCSSLNGFSSIDWSQIEPVTLANVAGDMRALNYYESGQKFYHALIAAASDAGVSLEYKASKIVLLAQMYGESFNSVCGKNGWSRDQGQALVDAVWAALPRSRDMVHAYDRDVSHRWGSGRESHEGQLRWITREYGMMITISGRIIPVPLEPFKCWPCEGSGRVDPEDESSAMCLECRGKGKKPSRPVHKGCNYFVQGSAYDVLAESEYKIVEAGLGDAVYFSMHDELVCRADAAHEIRKIMSTPPERLCMWAKRLGKPVLNTDLAHIGVRWASV